MSTRETILAAVASILVTANVASGRVYRTRTEQIATLPAVEVKQVGAEAMEVVLGRTDHEVTFTVAALANGDTPDTAADAVLAAAHTALMADMSLGLGNEIQLHQDWQTNDPEVSDYDYIRHSHTYKVRYRTATGSF